MDVCRICLTQAVERDITQLTEELKGDQKRCWDIMVFCVNIQVGKKNSTLPTKRNLCANTPRKAHRLLVLRACFVVDG